ncbi:hypothetical protein C8R46DRAFT_1058151 [Mycena filopes]|nr:hypothetical protein C8R46DRAFT_1058151 [Mycena filopes]
MPLRPNIFSLIKLERPGKDGPIMSTFYASPPGPPPNNNYANNYAYSPTHNPQGSISMATFNGSDASNIRLISRTPSPTRSEYNALNGIKEERSPKQKILLYGVGALVIGVVILISVFHEKIINGLKPATDWMHDHKIGPLIPIALLFIMSFPPLMGHEIVEMVCGVTFDLAPAFGIVAAGVLLGEIANYFTFKFCCTARSKKQENAKLSYALLAHVVRTGGFIVVLMIRYSAIPPHFATAIFSTVGLGFGVFIAACVLSLPKAFVPVYIGYLLRPENDSKNSKKIETIVLVISVGITVVALGWVRRQMAEATPDVVYARRKARQDKQFSSG